MSDVKPSRPYRSPLREEAAQATRRAILDAARDLFIRQGYGGTSIDQIASLAGVSKPTVFASVGSKRVVLKELRDIALAGDDQPIPVSDRPAIQRILAEPDPRRMLRMYASNLVRVYARYADLEEVLHAAAGADDELRDLWKTNESERLGAARMLVRNLMTKGALRPGLDHAHASDILWLFMATDTYRRLVRDQEWSEQRFETWLGGTLCELLLGSE